MQNGDVYSSVVIILQCVPQSRHQLPGQHPVSLLPFVSNDSCILVRLCWFAGTHEDTFPREAMWKCLRGIVLLLNLTYYVRLCENRPLRKGFDRRTPNSGRLEQALHQEYQTQPTKLPLFSYYFHYNGTGCAQYLHLPLFRPNMATLATFGLGCMTLTCLLYSVWIFVIGTKKRRYLFMVYIWTVWWL